MSNSSVNDVFVKARLGAASSMRLTETYESATVLGQTVDLPQAVILYHHSIVRGIHVATPFTQTKPNVIILFLKFSTCTALFI
jgi:hypothetical protein